MALTIDQLDIQITADSQKATRALTSLIKKLENLKKTLNGGVSANINIATSFNQTTNSANKATSAINKHDAATKKTSKSTKSFSDNLANQISKWRTLTGAFKTAANMMSGLFTESNSYVETLNLFNVTMGDAAESSYKFAESVQKLVGIDVAEWMNFQGTFKQLTSGFGVAEEHANTMSQNLTQLSYDLASFFNTDVETAFDKLSSAMAGQVKGLREFGIDTTVASLQEYALARGIEKKVSKMTQAEKSLLRYNYIMEKSTKIQGDMARTLVTPANAMRILNSQLTQMKRALGNVVSVLVAKFIPYTQAIVRVVTDAANAIANFFGFELPTIDYSGFDTGEYADDLEAGENALVGSSDAAKKLKKQLMGFDELNIISNPDKDSGSDSGAGGSSLNGMQPIEYDFLKGLDTSKVDRIYSTVKKMLSPLKKIWNYLDDYKDTIGAIAIVIAGIGLVKWIKNVATALGALKFVDYFLTGFMFIKAVGGNFFQNFRGGLDMIRQNLTFVQSALITAVAGIVEFVAIKDSVKALALGCEDVGAKIVTIGVVAAAAAIAMYTALGPAGLALAAVIGLAGAIAGVAEANKEMMEQMVSDVFYDGVGVKITDLANHFKGLMDTIIETNQPILDNKETINEATEAIDGTKSSIEYLITSYERGIISTEVFSSQVAEKLEVLNSNVKIAMDAIHSNIMYALSTSLGDAVESAGGSVNEYLAIIGKIKQDGDNLYNSLIEKQKELGVQFANGEIDATEYATGLREVNDKLAELSGSTSIVTTFSDKIDGLRNSVNWENEEATKNAFNTINTSASDAKSAVNESCDEIKRNLETMKLWTTDQNAIAALDELILGNEESRKQQLVEIDNAVNTMYHNLQTDILAGIDETAKEAAAKWDSMNGWSRFWSGAGTEAEYVSLAIQTYNNDFVKPLSKDIEESMDQIGADGSVWASAAVDYMMQHAFTYSASSGFGYVSGYAKDVAADMESAMKEAGVDSADGFTDGVSARENVVKSAFSKMAQNAINSVAETQDSHSPSKEFGKLGFDAVQGYANEVSDKFYKIKDAFVKNFEKLFEEISKLAKESFSESAWSGYANSITKALSNIKMPTFKSIGLNVSFSTWVSADKKKIFEALGLSGWPSLNWYTYAQGGFPSVGEMFIAREAGPELVGNIGRKTAVANNDQIVSGIEAGVYRAVVAANSGNSGGSQTIHVITEIDGDVIGEKVIKYHNGKVMQTGASPLLV